MNPCTLGWYLPLIVKDVSGALQPSDGDRAQQPKTAGATGPAIPGPSQNSGRNGHRAGNGSADANISGVSHDLGMDHPAGAQDGAGIDTDAGAVVVAARSEEHTSELQSSGESRMPSSA